MRLLFLLTSLLFVAAGIVFGALNPEPARVDFYWFGFNASLGVLLLLFALVGAVGGGVALWIGKIWPLQRSLRRARRERSQAAVPASLPPPDTAPGSA
jgi:putative membrane protein